MFRFPGRPMMVGDWEEDGVTNNSRARTVLSPLTRRRGSDGCMDVSAVNVIVCCFVLCFFSHVPQTIFCTVTQQTDTSEKNKK